MTTKRKKGGRVTPKGTLQACRPRTAYYGSINVNRVFTHLFTSRHTDSKGARVICSWCGKRKP